jgi:hypothetical protein
MSFDPEGKKRFIPLYKSIPYKRPLFKRLGELDQVSQGRVLAESQPVENLNDESLDSVFAEDEVIYMDEEDKSEPIVVRTAENIETFYGKLDVKVNLLEWFINSLEEEEDTKQNEEIFIPGTDVTIDNFFSDFQNMLTLNNVNASTELQLLKFMKRMFPMCNWASVKNEGKRLKKGKEISLHKNIVIVIILYNIL